MLLKKGSHSDDLRTLRALEKEYAYYREPIGRMISGVEGEKSTAHYLDRDFARDDDFAVLHDLRIGMVGDLAQTDHVVIDRLTGIVWVLETKNVAGTLTWNEHGDWTAVYPSGPMAMESPTAQAQRHCTSISEWLRHQEIQVAGVRPAVLVGPRTLLSRSITPDGVPVMKADVFPGWLRARRMAHMATATGNELSVLAMRTIGERMVAAHRPMADWRKRLSLPAVPPQPDRQRPTNRNRGIRTMSRGRRSNFEDLMHIAARSQIGALSVGAVGLAMASPLPHAALDALTSRTLSDDPYVAMGGSGVLGAFYMMIPWLRSGGFLIAGLAVVILLVQGRRAAYRTHLRTVGANAGGAGALAALAILLAFQDPPKLLPGKRETAEAMAAATGRPAGPAIARARERTPAVPRQAETGAFPDSGTVEWGEEQPIGGNLAQLDVWDATQSPQDKVINVRRGASAYLPGSHTPPYATLYLKAGQRASLRLPADGPYRITAMSGSSWKGSDALFGEGATTVDFGVVTLSPAQPQAVVMGAPDQTATVVPASRF